MDEAVPEKRRPGRPRKVVEVTPEPKPAFRMKAKPNWEVMEADSEDTPDRLRIDPSLVPDDFALQWATTSIYGQDVPQRRSLFEKRGWTPVHQEDFDGRFDGMFMPKGASGEITMEGLVLMARPKELSDRAKRAEYIKAREQVSVKEQALRGGDLPVTLDARHSTALNTNRISKSVERITIPKD